MTTEQAAASLTPEEWNAAYFLGLESIFQRNCTCNVPEQVLEGARILAAAGCPLHHFDPNRERTVDGYRTPAGVHEHPCQAIANGTFDMVHRARAAVRWLNTHAPRVNTRWLVGLIGTYDQLHPGPAEGDSPGHMSREGSVQAPQSPASREGAPDG